MPAVFDDRDVDVDHIALFQGFVIRDAMTNLVVDRCAHRFGVGPVTTALVIERSRNSALHLGDVVVCQLVDFVGGDTRLDERRQVVQHFRGEPTRDAHAVNAFGVFVGNCHGSIIPEGGSVVCANPI